MTARKKRRLVILVTALLGLGAATALVLTAFRDTLVFFYSPSDLLEHPPGARTIRLGGMVEKNSLAREPGSATVRFAVTDFKSRQPVTYTGILPDLFREGQGVVAEGKLRPDGLFEAREVLAKHDATYMPPTVADALRRAASPDGGHATSSLSRN